jgi:serine/threonine protein kinase
MWSVGCIFAELFSKRPVFMCKSEDEVLAKVFFMLGTPNETYCPAYLKLPKFDRKKWGSTKTQNNLGQMFPDAPPAALDLLSKLLTLDPNKRLLAK